MHAPRRVALPFPFSGASAAELPLEPRSWDLHATIGDVHEKGTEGERCQCKPFTLQRQASLSLAFSSLSSSKSSPFLITLTWRPEMGLCLPIAS